MKILPPRRRHLMDAWRDTLTTELRMRLVRGDVIGDALAEVDAYCADSGQTPDQAFGDPVAYAVAVSESLPGTAQVPATRWWEGALQTAGTVLGVTFLFEGLDAVAHSGSGSTGSGTVAWGSLLSAVLVVVVVVAVVALLPRLAARTPWLLGLGVALGMTAAVLPPVLWTAQAFSVPAWALLTGGVLALAVWVPFLRPLRGTTRDLVIDPRTGRESFTTPKVIGVLAWTLPAVLLVAAVLVVTLPAPR